MHLFVCLISLVLTFQLSSLKENNSTAQNVHEMNISQSISYDDIFENTTELDAALEASDNKTEELEISTLIVSSTEVGTDRVLSTPSEKIFTDPVQNQTDEASALPSAVTTHNSIENSSTTSSAAETSIDPEVYSLAGIQLSPTPKESLDTEFETLKTETTRHRSTTTSTLPPNVHVATLEYESDKNHDELILSGIFSDNHQEDDDDASFPFRVRTDTETEHITPTYAELTPAVVESASLSVTPHNITSYEEAVEHNAILSTDSESANDKTIVVGHKCTRIFQESILWNVTDGGMLALKSCPPGYQGNMYRPCFSNGKWGNVDYSECRLEHLGRMRHMVS